MMEAAQTSVGNHDRARRRLWFHGAAIRRIFFQGIVNAVLMVVTHVVPDDPAKMWLVQRNDMVEHLAAATAHPAFRDTVLPGCLDTGSFGCQAGRLQERDDVDVEL